MKSLSNSVSGLATLIRSAPMIPIAANRAFNASGAGFHRRGRRGDTDSHRMNTDSSPWRTKPVGWGSPAESFTSQTQRTEDGAQMEEDGGYLNLWRSWRLCERHIRGSRKACPRVAHHRSSRIAQPPSAVPFALAIPRPENGPRTVSFPCRFGPTAGWRQETPRQMRRQYDWGDSRRCT